MDLPKEKIFNELQDIVKYQFGKEILDYQTTLIKNGINSLDLESLDIVNLIVKIEEHFNIIVDYDVLYITIDDVVNNVYELLKNT